MPRGRSRCSRRGGRRTGSPSRRRRAGSPCGHRLPVLRRDALAHDPAGDRDELVVDVLDALGVDSSRTRRTASSRPSASTKRSRSVIAQPPCSCSSDPRRPKSPPRKREGRAGAAPSATAIPRCRRRPGWTVRTYADRRRRVRSVARRAMLERNQLHPLVERVLAQAGPATRSRPGTDGVPPRRGRLGGARRSTARRPTCCGPGCDDLVETGKVHDADAYVCVAHRNDLGLAGRGARYGPAGTDRDTLAVIAQSRVGDRVCGTATEADGWAVDESGCEPFREIREQLTAILLPRA